MALLQTSIRTVYRRLKQIPDRIRYPRPSRTFQRLGSPYGGWWIETRFIHQTANVIAAGVGEDISFDLALIKRFGCQLLALDPTPKAIAHAAKFRHEQRFHFDPRALACTDGNIVLSPPADPANASYTWHLHETRQPGQSFPAVSLSTLMQEQGWKQIDLLKLDIEGSEYAIIEQIVTAKLPIKQLCIEFHKDIAAQLQQSIQQSIATLASGGWRLVYKEGENYTFLHQNNGKE